MKTTEITRKNPLTLRPESDEDVFETAKDVEGDNSDVNVETDDRNLIHSQEIDEIIESVAAEKQRLLEANANRCEETPDDLMANAEVEILMNSDDSRILTVAKPAELENKAFKTPQVALKDTIIDKEDKENEEPAKTNQTNQNSSADIFSSTSQLSVQLGESENFSLAVNVGLPVTQNTGKLATKELLIVLDKVNVNPLVDSRSSEQRVENDGMDTCELLAVLTNSQSQRGSRGSERTSRCCRGDKLPSTTSIVTVVAQVHHSKDSDIESAEPKDQLKQNLKAEYLVLKEASMKMNDHDPDKSKSYAEPKPKVKKVTKTKQPEADIKKARKSRKLAKPQAESTKSTSLAEFLLKDDDDGFGSSKKAKVSTVSSKAKDKLLEKINAPDNSWGLDQIFSRVQKNKKKEITTAKADIPENAFEGVPKKSDPRRKVEVPKPDTRRDIVSAVEQVDQPIKSPSPIPISRDCRLLRTDFINKAQALHTNRKLDDVFNVVDEAEEMKPSHLIAESLLNDTIKTKEKLKMFSQLFDETESTKSKNEPMKSNGRKRRKLYRLGSTSHLEGTIGPLGAETPPQSDLALNTVSNKKKRKSEANESNVAKKLNSGSKTRKSRKWTKAEDDCINASKLTNIFNNALDENPLKFKCPHCRKCIKTTSSRPLSPWVGESRPPTSFNDDGRIDIVDSYATRQHTIPEAPRPSNINILEHIRLLPGNSDIQDNNDIQEPTLNQNTENSSVHPFNLPRDGEDHSNWAFSQMVRFIDTLKEVKPKKKNTN